MRDHRLKHQRAVEHVETLKAAMQQDGQRLFHHLRLEPDGGSGELIVRADFGEPPHQWGLIAGDAIHNFRSSLDALILALFEAMGGPLTDAEVQSSQFPIFEKPSRFNAWLTQWRDRVPERATSFLRKVQPFSATEWMHGPPLRALSRLDNIDKHRRLLIVSSFVAQGTLNVYRRDHSPLLQGIALSGGLVRPGNEVARIRLPDGLQHSEVYLNYNVGRSVVFGDALQDASLSVQTQLDIFAVFLDQTVFRTLEQYF